MRVLQVDQLPHAQLPYAHRYDQLRFYYDETNNIRRLTLSELGLNAPADRVFALAGIVLTKDQAVTGWGALRAAMQIQPSALEVKYKHVADSDFLSALGSGKLGILLNWLRDQKILIYYSVMDIQFWSIVDIIDSLYSVDPYFIAAAHLDLKNELRAALETNPSGFYQLLHKHGYPDIDRGRASEFIQDLRQFIALCFSQDRSLAFTTLLQLLKEASKNPELVLDFLHDESEGELIKDFSINFMQPMYVYPRSKHVFDEENFIRNILATLELVDGNTAVDYSFIDSKKSVEIQIADVIAGFVGRYFTFLGSMSSDVLINAKNSLTTDQKLNLSIFRDLIDRSHAFSEGLLHAVMPHDTMWKHDFFLRGYNLPEHLL